MPTLDKRLAQQVLGDQSAYSLCKEMSRQMKLTHCVPCEWAHMSGAEVNGFVASASDMPTCASRLTPHEFQRYGQLGCQGFIILDREQGPRAPNSFCVPCRGIEWFPKGPLPSCRLELRA